MSYIGANGAGFVCAGRDGKIYIKALGEDKAEMPLNLFKTYKFGDEYKISRVAYENGTESFKFGDETRNTLWLNQDNIFIVDEKQVENIYNKLKGLTVNSFEGTAFIDPRIDMGDILVIGGRPIIYQGEMTFNRRFIADIKSKINIKQRQETTVKKQSQTSIRRKLQSQIDEANGKIIQLVEEQTETSNKLSQHEQTIDGITDRVSKVDEKVDNTREELSSQITQTVEGVKSEVNKSISTAKQEAIDSANTSTDNKLKGYYTSEQTKSLISQESDNIELSVSKKIENIQIGGTNILRNSAPYNNLDYWMNFGSVTSSIIDESSSPSGKAVKVHHNNNSLAGIYNLAKKLEVGKQYSWSVWIKASKTVEITIGQEQDGRKKVNVTTQWQKFSYTYTAKENNYFAFIFYVDETDFNKTGLDVYIHSAKLEEGNKVTGWSPSPDDSPTKSEMNSAIQQTAEEIKSIVSVSIGTVNLASNSDFSHQNSSLEYDMKNWERLGVMQSSEEYRNNKVVLDGEKTWLRLFKDTAGSFGISQILKPVRKNEDYTLSFQLKNNRLNSNMIRISEIDFIFYLYSSDGSVLDTITNTFNIQNILAEQSFNFTLHTPQNDNLNYIDFRIMAYRFAGEEYENYVFDSNITNIQLEIGKIATEWRASQPDYYDKIEQYSKVVQTVDNISSEVSKKVGEDEIISKINQSAETVGIDAQKIELSANDILNLLAGNSINIKSRNIKIQSDKFTLDQNGNMTCSNANITGGKINLDAKVGEVKIKVGNEDIHVDISPNGICFHSNNELDYMMDLGYVNSSDGTSSGYIRIVNNDLSNETELTAEDISTNTVYYKNLTKLSLESLKKNIKLYDKKAIDIIKNSDIYEYNYKNEDDKDKKHIGFVIGNQGGKYKTPNDVLSKDEKGIDGDNITSILWKGMQELIEQNKILTSRIEILEKGGSQ